ncbi:hypothetical protein [Reinekea blandensis]|nr:hypothetical protein [Reinekea blandensis]
MNSMLKLVSFFLVISALSSCVHMHSSSGDSDISLVVDPFVFRIDSQDRPVIEVLSFTGSLAGANVTVGENNEVGFGLSKTLPTGLFANGPVQLGMKNREFLESLLDGSNGSETLSKYRQALGVSNANEILQYVKGDWLFILLSTELGPVAYGATNNYDLVFQINHNESFAALDELIEEASLK